MKAKCASCGKESVILASQISNGKMRAQCAGCKKGLGRSLSKSKKETVIIKEKKEPVLTSEEQYQREISRIVVTNDEPIRPLPIRSGPVSWDEFFGGGR